jgi:hypothetical protein
MVERRSARLLAVVLAITLLVIAYLMTRREGGYEPTDHELREAVYPRLADEVTDAVWDCIVRELTDEWSAADKRAVVAGLGDHDYSVRAQRQNEVHKKCGVPGM